GAVGVDGPLLVGSAMAVPDDGSGAVARTGSGRVQALVAVDPQLPARGVRPALVDATVAVPQLDLGAVGGAGARHVEAAVRLRAHDHGVLLRATGLRVAGR